LEVGLNLLITADPGARAHFVAAWLTDRLEPNHFDVGISSKSQDFVKNHTDWNNDFARNFSGVKIRVRTSFRKLYLHLYLFLIKNIMSEDLDQDPYGLACVNKMIESAKFWFHHDNQVDESLYDHVLEFADTFDRDCMIDLYQTRNRKQPGDQHLQAMDSINQNNLANIDKNHACHIGAMILEKEHTLGLREIDRIWSLEQIYQTTSKENLFETISSSIYQDNYGTSDLHGIGVNKITRSIHGLI